MDGLTIGRIVHFVFSENVHLPAIVTVVGEGRAEGTAVLFIFANPETQFVNQYQQVQYDENKSVNTWHWPERNQPSAYGPGFPKVGQDGTIAAG